MNIIKLTDEQLKRLVPELSLRVCPSDINISDSIIDDENCTRCCNSCWKNALLNANKEEKDEK